MKASETRALGPAFVEGLVPKLNYSRPMNLAGQANTDNRGYAMAVLLVGLGVMAILLTAAMPVWRQVSQREKEEELIFRGTQYARAVGLYQRKYANTSPPTIDVLVEQRFLRSKYKDPMVPDGEFQLLYQTTQAPGSSGARGAQAASPGGGGQGGAAIGKGPILGVVSKSSQTALRVYNGGTHYNEWQFVAVARTLQPGVGQGGGTPGAGRGGRGQGRSGTGIGSGTSPDQSPPARRGQGRDQPREGGPGGFGGAPPSRSR
jgi:type II secretory pathway pseudopilin PulG